MGRRISTHIVRTVLTAGIVLGVLGALRPFDGVYPEHSRRAQDRLCSGQALRLRSGQALAATGNIDPVNKWAWGTNVGWINFRPDHGGVTVYPDHLEGYAWGENIGWIRLGSYTGGGAHTYGNTSNTDYGVNRDASGHLSGYAWNTNVGWINFSPTHGGVTIDPATGSFDGYAWGENVGWIRFGNRVNKWGWGNAGWINLNPTHGGVAIYPDHLEGYAWGENIGWIRLGTHTGGGAHTYGNTSAANYGVNNDGSGNLSGYAWSTNAGWINFSPTHGGVTVDFATGSFDGYAWGENIGWIHFAYNVVVDGDIYLPIILKSFP
jgi:hypothetical protein